MENKKESFIKEFNNINKMKAFIINDKILYIDIENDFLIAGGVCNAGLLKEYEMPIDFDLSLDQNLENFYHCIIEKMEA